MTTEVRIPLLPESTELATISQIYVSEGQVVTRDQNLFDVETDKVVLEVVAPATGVVGQVTIELGDQVKTEQLVMHLREVAGSESAAIPAAPERIETIAQDKPNVDAERLLLEEVVGKSLFDRRGVICGGLGLIFGIIIGTLGTLGTIAWIG